MDVPLLRKYRTRSITARREPVKFSVAAHTAMYGKDRAAKVQRILTEITVGFFP
ncbi:hypothetical protein [Musicola keenii]|uniref:hypothetical protein n=1 Tax=Musicola keenii TaxID=2884250 RepID=UPI00177E97C3|nr:hypothetical protein [Musicola keenii]